MVALEKILEDKRRHSKFVLCTNKKQSTRVASKLIFKNFNITSETLTLATLDQEQVCLDKPISAGCAILESSKLRMFEFHYEYIRQKYDDVTLLFTDTDSLCYEIVMKNVYEDIRDDRDKQYDTSDFPKDHICHSLKNQKIPEFMRRDGWSSNSRICWIATKDVFGSPGRRND